MKLSEEYLEKIILEQAKCNEEENPEQRVAQKEKVVGDALENMDQEEIRALYYSAVFRSLEGSLSTHTGFLLYLLDNSSFWGGGEEPFNIMQSPESDLWRSINENLEIISRVARAKLREALEFALDGSVLVENKLRLAEK